MVVKQIYSLIEYDEAVKPWSWCRQHWTGADAEWWRSGTSRANRTRAPHFRRMQASWRHLRGHHADQRSRRDDRACQRGAA